MEPSDGGMRHIGVTVEQSDHPSHGVEQSKAEPFDDFYRREYPRVLQLTWLLTHSASASEDITQEAFLSVHRRYDSLDSAAAYLTRTVTNMCHSWHRSAFRRAALLRQLVGRAQPVNGDVEYLLDAVARLPYRQRVVVVCRYWAGWSETEIADALGVRPGTVKSLASRALARLRQEVQK